jgi:hypothetical protein
MSAQETTYFLIELKILVEIHISRLILQRWSFEFVISYSKLYIFDLKKEENLTENHTSFPIQ